MVTHTEDGVTHKYYIIAPKVLLTKEDITRIAQESAERKRKREKKSVEDEHVPGKKPKQPKPSTILQPQSQESGPSIGSVPMVYPTQSSVPPLISPPIPSLMWPPIPPMMQFSNDTTRRMPIPSHPFLQTGSPESNALFSLPSADMAVMTDNFVVPIAPLNSTSEPMHPVPCPTVIPNQPYVEGMRQVYPFLVPYYYLQTQQPNHFGTVPGDNFPQLIANGLRIDNPNHHTPPGVQLPHSPSSNRTVSESPSPDSR